MQISIEFKVYTILFCIKVYSIVQFSTVKATMTTYITKDDDILKQSNSHFRFYLLHFLDASFSVSTQNPGTDFSL